MPNPYNDPYGNAQTQWRQGAQPPDQSQPSTQGGYQINNQYFQPNQTQKFGSTPETIYPGGQIGAPDPNAVAASLTQTMGRKAPTIAGADFSGMGATQASQLGILDKMRGYAQGLGPSAAQIGSTMGLGQAAMASHAGLGGANPLAARAAMSAQSSGMGNAAAAGAQARTGETGEMMNALGKQSNGLAGNALGASSLADLQIQQQQALGLGQAQRNYALAQGTIGNALQSQMDLGKYNQLMQQNYQSKQLFNDQQATKDAATAAQAAAMLAAMA